jgi:glycosyltransferase, family 1
MIDLNKNFKNDIFHIIYYEWHLDLRGGGPTGYLANLLDGLNRIENNVDPLIFFDTAVKQNALPEHPDELHKFIHSFFYKNDARKNFYINNISRYKKIEHENYIKFLSAPRNMFCSDAMFKNINLKTTKTIHAHTIGDLIKLRNSLDRLGNHTTKLLLTCHTPERPSAEYYKSYLEQGYSDQKALAVKEKWEIIEKMAFKNSDILIFPSKEAMEPLLDTMDGFEDIIKQKDIRFIPTGAKKLKSSLTKDAAKEKYGVTGKFVVGYVGRHNEIKGYDILMDAAKQLIPNNPNICFLIGGAQGKTFKPLEHEQWIEAGWVNPADLFMAIDVFVLPNRMTYYDLVLLEVMSMGVPVIASATGGNKSVYSLTNALTLYDNSVEDLAAKIVSMSNLSQEEITHIQNETLAAYENNFTTSLFAERYKKLINDIYADYNFLPTEDKR